MNLQSVITLELVALQERIRGRQDRLRKELKSTAEKLGQPLESEQKPPKQQRLDHSPKSEQQRLGQPPKSQQQTPAVDNLITQLEELALQQAENAFGEPRAKRAVSSDFSLEDIENKQRDAREYRTLLKLNAYIAGAGLTAKGTEDLIQNKINLFTEENPLLAPATNLNLAAAKAVLTDRQPHSDSDYLLFPALLAHALSAGKRRKWSTEETLEALLAFIDLLIKNNITPDTSLNNQSTLDFLLKEVIIPLMDTEEENKEAVQTSLYQIVEKLLDAGCYLYTSELDMMEVVCPDIGAGGEEIRKPLLQLLLARGFGVKLLSVGGHLTDLLSAACHKDPEAIVELAELFPPAFIVSRFSTFHYYPPKSDFANPEEPASYTPYASYERAIEPSIFKGTPITAYQLPDLAGIEVLSDEALLALCLPAKEMLKQYYQHTKEACPERVRSLLELKFDFAAPAEEENPDVAAGGPMEIDREPATAEETLRSTHSAEFLEHCKEAICSFTKIMEVLPDEEKVIEPLLQPLLELLNQLKAAPILARGLASASGLHAAPGNPPGHDRNPSTARALSFDSHP